MTLHLPTLARTAALRCPNCGAALPTQAELDGRATHWRVRVRLYASTRPDEPLADSDPELPPDAPGASVEHGLPMVALSLEVMATHYHKAQCVGLEPATLSHRLKSLRPTIARRRGNAVWRVPYTVAGRDYLARVDVVREEQQT